MLGKNLKSVGLIACFFMISCNKSNEESDVERAYSQSVEREYFSEDFAYIIKYNEARTSLSLFSNVDSSTKEFTVKKNDDGTINVTRIAEVTRMRIKCRGLTFGRSGSQVVLTAVASESPECLPEGKFFYNKGHSVAVFSNKNRAASVYVDGVKEQTLLCSGIVSKAQVTNIFCKNQKLSPVFSTFYDDKRFIKSFTNLSEKDVGLNCRFPAKNNGIGIYCEESK